MLLALDIGNTQSSFGIFKQGKSLHHWRAETKISQTPDELASFLFQLLNHSGLPTDFSEGIAVCSVVPPATENFVLFCRQYFGRDPFVVTHRCELGFELNVETPADVGPDRLANAAYAIKHLTLPAIVVDLGTATTFDVITKDKVYQGGVILPGVRMGAESLSKRTSLLPLIDVQFPTAALGKSTKTCIQSGVLFGYCDAIDGLLGRLQAEIGAPCEVVLTGGVGPLFAPHLKTKVKSLPDLTLEGTLILFQQNC